MKRLLSALALALALATAAFSAQAQVDVGSAWVRGTVAGQTATAAYLTLTAREPGATLVGASSPVAASAEIHEMKMDGNVMRMRTTPRLALPAGKAVELKPGGYHIMLLDLKAPLKAGDTVPLTLSIALPDGKTARQEIRAEVRPLAAPAGHDMHGHGQDMHDKTMH